MNTCCCCHGKLLKHLKGDRAYWFCLACHQEMPNLHMDTPINSYKVYRDKLYQNKLTKSLVSTL